MPSSTPAVSVVIPTYNRADLLPRAINSVLRQTYTEFELIVVDDASDDETPHAVASFEDSRIRYTRHETNRHASAARNTGINHSRGKYIAFLDDDDEWLPAKLSEQVELFESAPPPVGLVYCWMDYFDDKGQLVSEVHPTLRGRVFDQVLDRQRLAGCPTLLVRRAVVEEVGGFDESLPRGNDGDFIRRVCLRYEVDLVPRVLVRVHTGHGLHQISGSDEEGIRNSIHGHKAKLVKFKDELPAYPSQTAAIHATIGHHYSQLGDWKNSAAAYREALRITPLSTTVYLSILRSLARRLLKPRKRS